MNTPRILFGFAVILALSGCTATESSQDHEFEDAWVLYQETSGAFEFSYPNDWTQTASSNELQFWWTDPEGETLVKLAVTQRSDASLEDIAAEIEADMSDGINEWVSTTRNGHDVIIANGTLLSDFQTYYYYLGEEIWTFTAYIHDADSAVWETVTSVQDSVQKISP
jgi:hypothetical protein